MNNFVFGNDPLLYTNPVSVPNMHNEVDIKRQLDSVMAQYQAMQQQRPPQQPQEDYLGDLDNLTRSLDENMLIILNNDAEYIQINTYIQETIQIELMRDIKARLNNNPEVVNKVKRIKEIINEIKSEKENEDRRSMNELNDYIKNYSDMTFNEYKQLKSKK
jgi:hypothetical protein